MRERKTRKGECARFVAYVEARTFDEPSGQAVVHARHQQYLPALLGPRKENRLWLFGPSVYDNGYRLEVSS
jgi:hypothetical protein